MADLTQTSNAEEMKGMVRMGTYISGGYTVLRTSVYEVQVEKLVNKIT